MIGTPILLQLNSIQNIQYSLLLDMSYHNLPISPKPVLSIVCFYIDVSFRLIQQGERSPHDTTRLRGPEPSLHMGSSEKR